MKPPALINRTAASIAAAAIFEVFPGSGLFGGKETDAGFFYQFFYSHPLPPEARSLLEEKMRQIVREERAMRQMEMVAYSAKELFLRADHLAAADYLETLDPKELVSLIQIGSFTDLVEQGPLSSLQEVGSFQITELKRLKSGQIRVEGVAFPTKGEVKKFLRNLSKYSKENHLIRGQALKFWQWREDRLLWLERGLEARKNLFLFLKRSFEGEELRSSSEELIESYCFKRMPFSSIVFQERFQDPSGEKGFFEESCQSIFQRTTYCFQKDLKNFSISLLQSIDKTFTILGFRTSSRLVGRQSGKKELQRLGQVLGLKVVETQETEPMAEWLVEDGFGRMQTVLTLRILEKTEERMLLRLQVGVEKILALLLEHTDVLTSEGLQQIEKWGEQRLNRTFKFENQ